MAARHSFPSDPELELGLSHLSPFSYLYSMSRRLKSEYILVRAWGFVLLCETAAHVVDIAKGAVQMTRSESAQPARDLKICGTITILFRTLMQLLFSSKTS